MCIPTCTKHVMISNVTSSQVGTVKDVSLLLSGADTQRLSGLSLKKDLRSPLLLKKNQAPKAAVFQASYIKHKDFCRF